MTMMTVDLSNLNQTIDFLKSNKDQQNTYDPINLIEYHTKFIRDMLEDGWPAQEIAFKSNDVPHGIPIEIGWLLFFLLEYCAWNNIDIVESLRTVLTNAKKFEEDRNNS